MLVGLLSFYCIVGNLSNSLVAAKSELQKLYVPIRRFSQTSSANFLPTPHPPPPGLAFMFSLVATLCLAGVLAAHCGHTRVHTHVRMYTYGVRGGYLSCERRFRGLFRQKSLSFGSPHRRRSIGVMNCAINTHKQELQGWNCKITCAR